MKRIRVHVVRRGHEYAIWAARGRWGGRTLTGELQKRNAYDRIGVTYSGCLGPCDSGPNVLVYPEGVMYAGVTKDDVLEIFDKHLEGDEVVTRLQAPAAVW